MAFPLSHLNRPFSISHLIRNDKREGSMTFLFLFFRDENNLVQQRPMSREVYCNRVQLRSAPGEGIR